MALTNVGPEYIDTVYRVQGDDKVRAAARAVDVEIEKIGPSATRASTQASSSFDRMSQSMSRVSRVASGFGALEIFNRMVSITRSLASAIGDLAERTPRTNAQLDRLKTATGRVSDEFVRGLDTGRLFSSALGGMADGMTGATDTARTFGVAISNLIVGVRELNHVLSSIQTAGLSEVVRYMRDLAMRGTERVERFLSPGDEIGPVVPGWTPSSSGDVETEALPRPGSGRGDHGRGSYRWGEPPPARRGGGGGGRSSNWISTAGYSGAEAGETAASEAHIADLYAQQTEALRDQMRVLDERASKEQAFAEAQQAAFDEQIRNQEKLHDQEMRRFEEEAAQAQKYQQRIQRVQSQVEGYAGAFVTVGGAIGSVFDQLAASEEEGSAEAKKWGKVKGGILAAMSFIQSAIEYAAGISSIATHDYVAAAAHFASGIAYDVAGGMAIAQLGGSATPASTGSTSGGAYVPEATADARYESEATGTYIEINTMGASSARLAQEIRRADRQLSRAGLDSPMQRAGGFSS